MKVLAIVCGRKNQSTERIARVALHGALEYGAEVELVNLMDLDIRPCINCRACTRTLIDPDFHGRCAHDADDMKWLDEQILSSDALLFTAPMFECAVPGPYKVMCDRFGPSHDVTFRRSIYEKRKAEGRDPGIDERWFKERPAAFIGHGGSEWSYLSFPTLANPAVSLGLTIVDYLRFDWSSRGLFLDDDKLARIEECGRHLAKMARKKPEEMNYIGPEGACPVCHCDVMRIDRQSGRLVCTLCGAGGRLVSLGDKGGIEMDPDAETVSHVRESGREIHMADLRSNARIRTALDQKEIERRMRPLQEEIPATRPDRPRA